MHTTFSRIFSKVLLGIIFFLLGFVHAFSQTNPVAQPISYIQGFGNNWFTLSSLPAGFAIWTATGAPCTSNTIAASSTANGNDNSFDSATVVKSFGKSYGYSGLSPTGVQVNNGQLYIQTGSASTGTDQLVLAINTTGYSTITVSFSIEMLNPQPKLTGFAFQYRIGTSGAFSTLDTSYWHNSSDRTQNQVDNFVNIPLPSSAENQSVVQLRWALSRSATPAGAGSCGLAFDNIVIVGTPTLSMSYYRSIASGVWNSLSVWESSNDNINWSPATQIPSGTEIKITIRSPHSISSSGIANLVVNQLVIDSGAIFQNEYGTLMAINDGAAVADLEVNGTFIDSSNYSVIWTSTSRWRMSSYGTLKKTTNTSSTNWQLQYYNGISNIPATSNWICRKPLGASVEPSLSSTNGGPPNAQVYFGNLFIENDAATWNSNNLCKFSGNLNYPIIKGNFYIGGSGSSVINFYNSNTNSSPLKVLGDVFIKSGSTLTVNGTGLELKGNIYCDGVYTHLASSSKLLFSGLNAQTVAGTGSITTNILEINKSSNDVTLNSTVFINGNLNLTWGIINTNQNSKIIVNDNATATNASDISYISGPIQKIGNDAFTFPVGKNGNYQSIGMDIGSGAQFSDAFTAEYFPDNPAIIFGDSLAPSLDHISHCEYWILKNDVGSAQKKVILSWDTRSCGVSNLTELTVARFNSVMWVDEGNSGTLGTVNSGTIASYTTTGYGPFTLASTTVANTLPLSLLSFTATYDGKEVKIKWMTVSELNNQYFTVERSSNGINFEKLFFTEGMGNSTNQVTYAGQDLNPLPGISYYRLKQTDFDGKTTYSFIIPVKVKREGIIILNMKSLKENSSIDFEISFPVPSNGLIEINDNNGRTIVSSKFSTPAQIRHFNFEMPGLIRGIYFLRIICENETLLKKFIF